MIYFVIAMRDRVADLYGQPVYVANIGAAIRGFSDQINDSTSPMNKHPDDYDLYELGTFDDESGQFVNLPQPRQLALGRDLIARK